MGILYLVATPIGNLDDMSTRAIKTLEQVELIAAEDTRQTRKLLSHFQIKTRLTSYHEQNKIKKIPYLLSELEKGDIALVSDAGTPALNDPGYELVRTAIQAGYMVSPIPGACAPIAALVASGLPTDKFLFLGYLPRKQNVRKKILQKFSHFNCTLIALEVPHRLIASLEDLSEILGGERKMVMARELTKLHEEFFRGSIKQVREYLQRSEPRGEITLVIAGDETETKGWTEEYLRKEILASLEANEPAAKLSARIAQKSGWYRRDIYQIAVEIQEQSK
jgi:16S rRNA (cytidine1402-2'-O)-methyltransferase